MYKLIFLFSAVLFMTSCSSEAQTSEESNGNGSTTQQQNTVINKVVSVSEFKELMAKENAQIIDVRTDGECAGGMIEGATQINFQDPNFRANLNKLDKTKPTLVYCAVGGRSARAAAMMKELGFQEVYDLQGGYNAWK